MEKLLYLRKVKSIQQIMDAKVRDNSLVLSDELTAMKSFLVAN